MLCPWYSQMLALSDVNLLLRSGQGEQATWPKIRLDSLHWVTVVKSHCWV